MASDPVVMLNRVLYRLIELRMEARNQADWEAYFLASETIAKILRQTRSAA